MKDNSGGYSSKRPISDRAKIKRHWQRPKWDFAKIYISSILCWSIKANIISAQRNIVDHPSVHPTMALHYRRSYHNTDWLTEITMYLSNILLIQNDKSNLLCIVPIPIFPYNEYTSRQFRRSSFLVNIETILFLILFSLREHYLPMTREAVLSVFATVKIN